MIRLIPLILLILAILYSIRYIRKQPPEIRKKLTRKAILGGLIITLAVLLLTGKLHWVGIAVAALIPLLGKVFSLAIRALPFLQPWLAKRAAQAQQHTQENNNNTAPSSSNMSTEEARSILGVSATATEQEIIDAHRKLMQKMHPDRGGNDYLAAKINLAKDHLLKR